MGFFLLAGKLTDLSLGAQRADVIIAGAGVGLMLGTASTDAVNRGQSASFSELTGITQTARNFGASLGLAVLGALLTTRNDVNITRALTSAGVPPRAAREVAGSLGSKLPSPTGHSHHAASLVHDVQLAFAHSTQTVFYVMGGVMVTTFLVAMRGLPRRRAQAAAVTDPSFVRPPSGTPALERSSARSTRLAPASAGESPRGDRAHRR